MSAHHDADTNEIGTWSDLADWRFAASLLFFWLTLVVWGCCAPIARTLWRSMR